ncbi:MAG TPA: GNAT family N-acetyltransferase [Verrucomicrobiae bacterium]|jgi:ribosomal protein S18 acetylase RimI-like enzyme
MNTPQIVSISEDVFEHFPIHLHVDIRFCVEDDLHVLEWFGLFTEHREIIQQAFEAQQRGENIMLVAEANTLPVAQAWIDLLKRKEESAGFIWAVRVIPWLQNLGIGAKMMAAAEQVCARRGLAFAELGVEKENHEAKRFYERQGYRLVGSLKEEYSYTTPDNRSITVPLDEWILRKPLSQHPDGSRVVERDHGNGSSPTEAAQHHA